jgi:predicted NAD/FAD-dependent oxidoreductase
VAPGYAPKDRSLISVSLLGIHKNSDIPNAVKEELYSWFGEQTRDWKHLRTDLIKHALPEQGPGLKSPGYLFIDGMHICGDHTSSASIEGAITSGIKTAEAIIAGQ